MAQEQPIRFGIVGLGTAGTAMLPSIARDDNFTLVAAADLDDSVLAKLREDFPGTRTYTDLEAMALDAELDAVFIATPTQHHTGHVLSFINAGKHVVTEKPIATNLEDADRMIEAAESAGTVLMVGHSFGYEGPIKAMREVVRSGELGELRMMHNWYYTDWMYRPRNPEELDTSLGGGVTFRQGSHQFDIIRYVAGGLLRSVRARTGRYDPARGAEGAHTVFLEFEDGVAATAVYNGYDHFRSAELGFNVGENGKPTNLSTYGGARKTLRGTASDAEMGMKREFRYGGPRNRGIGAEPFENAPFYGITLISFEHGDVRQSPEGLLVYGEDEVREIAVSKEISGRDYILRELHAAVRENKRPLHSGRWGKANLEVALAALQSSNERREILLQHQVPTTD